MIEKLYSLKKNNKGKIRTSQIPQTDVDDNSYNDYDYEASSSYLTKLEGRSRKINRSIYYQKNRSNFASELVEVDPHLEATPINRQSDEKDKTIFQKDLKSDDSLNSFRGA